MGTRIVHEIVTQSDDEATILVVLFSNCSHPAQDAQDVFERAVSDATGMNHLLERLFDVRYASSHGNHRYGDRIFNLVEAPYGDFEFVQRATHGPNGFALTTHAPEEIEALKVSSNAPPRSAPTL